MTAKQILKLADRAQLIADSLYEHGDEKLTQQAEALARALYLKTEALGTQEASQAPHSIGRRRQQNRAPSALTGLPKKGSE